MAGGKAGLTLLGVRSSQGGGQLASERGSAGDVLHTQTHKSHLHRHLYSVYFSIQFLNLQKNVLQSVGLGIAKYLRKDP